MIHRRGRTESGSLYTSKHTDSRGSHENLIKLSLVSQKSLTKRWWRLNKRFVIVALVVMLLVYIDCQQEQSATKKRQLQAEDEFLSWTECPAAIEQAKGLYVKTNAKNPHTSHNYSTTITREETDNNFAQNIVLLTASNLGYFPMLQTWESYAASSNLKWAVLALDEWMMQHSSSVPTHSEFFLRRSQRYRSSGYWSLQCNIWRSILSIVDRCEVDIVFSDVDNVILNDPFSSDSDLGQKLRSNAYDYLYHTNFPLNRPRQDECGQRFPTRGESTGFFYIRHDNAAMKDVLNEILNQCRLNDNNHDFDFWNIMARRGYSHCKNNSTTDDTNNNNNNNDPEDLRICCLSSAETKRNRRYDMEGHFSTYEEEVLHQIQNADEEVKSWHLNIGHRKLMKLLHAGLYKQMPPEDGEEEGHNTAAAIDPIAVVEPDQLLHASADVVQQIQKQQQQEEDRSVENDTNEEVQQVKEEVSKATNENDAQQDNLYVQKSEQQQDTNEVLEPNQLLQISAEVVQQKQEEVTQEESSKATNDNEVQQENLDIHQLGQQQDTNEVVEPNQLLQISAEVVQQKQEEVLRSANDNNQVIMHTDAAEQTKKEALNSADENYKAVTEPNLTEPNHGNDDVVPRKEEDVLNSTNYDESSQNHTAASLEENEQASKFAISNQAGDAAPGLSLNTATLEVLEQGDGPQVTRKRKYSSQVTLYVEHEDGSTTPSGWSTRKEDGAKEETTFDFQPGKKLIQGWTDGVLQMREGERAKLHVPALLGYGDRQVGKPGGDFFIPANSNLLFDIKILGKVGIKKYNLKSSQNHATPQKQEKTLQSSTTRNKKQLRSSPQKQEVIPHNNATIVAERNQSSTDVQETVSTSTTRKKGLVGTNHSSKVMGQEKAVMTPAIESESNQASKNGTAAVKVTRNPALRRSPTSNVKQQELFKEKLKSNNANSTSAEAQNDKDEVLSKRRGRKTNTTNNKPSAAQDEAPTMIKKTKSAPLKNIPQNDLVKSDEAVSVTTTSSLEDVQELFSAEISSTE